MAPALPVLVGAGGKRLAIQNQVIVESCSLQPSRSCRGGTEYTTKERLLLGGRTCQWGWPPGTSGATRTRQIVCAGRPARQPSCTHAPKSPQGAPIQLLQLMSLFDPRIKP